MTDPAERMRALERLRGVETEISRRVETLSRWIEADLQRLWEEEGHSGELPEHPASGRIEQWWRDLAPASGEGVPAGTDPTPTADRLTLDRIGVLAERLALVDAARLETRGDLPPYEPDRGDGAPIVPILEGLFRDLEDARLLRLRAGIEPS